MKNLNNLHKLNKTGTYAFLQSLLELTKKVQLTVDKSQQQQLVAEDVDGVEPVGRMTDRETLQVCQCPTAKILRYVRSSALETQWSKMFCSKNANSITYLITNIKRIF